MVNKILFSTTSDLFSRAFLIPHFKYFYDLGYEVHLATVPRGQVELPFVHFQYHIPFSRRIIHRDNLRSYSLLRRIFKNQHFEIVHCHTPIPSAITRIVANKYRKLGTKVIYTAHGFHFFKGASLKSWLIFFSIEKYLSKFTDALITINQEDLDTAIKRRFKSEVFKVNGVGIELEKFSRGGTNPTSLSRKDFGILEDDIVVLYVADFINRKNHQLLINQIPYMTCKEPKLKFLLVGHGPLLEHFKDLCNSLKIDNSTFFLGYRFDVPEIVKLCDLGVSTSTAEGLPINVLEHMAAGNPVVASQIRGHVDLIDSGQNGYLFKKNDGASLSKCLLDLSHNFFLKAEIGRRAQLHARKFASQVVMDQMEKIYYQLKIKVTR